MKYEMTVWYRLTEDSHVQSDTLQFDEFNIFPEGFGSTVQFQFLKDAEVVGTAWYRDVLKYHWKVINP